jgi:hypothetical protein
VSAATRLMRGTTQTVFFFRGSSED